LAVVIDEANAGTGGAYPFITTERWLLRILFDVEGGEVYLERAAHLALMEGF